jgi:chromosome segregation ATPase
MQPIAHLLANPLVVWLLVGVLFAWSAWSARQLASATSAVEAALAEARSRLEAASDPRDFSGDFETLAAALGGVRLIGPRWREVRDSLLVPSDLDTARLVRTASPPRLWFDTGSLLRSAGLDPRYHAALPNLLVGAGLLFTFLGLAAALASAGGIVAEDATQSERNRELKTLLDAASFKFVTSLVGLFLSLAYALFRKRCLRRVEGALDGFTAKLETLIPLVTPAALQVEANRLLSRQHEQLQAFNTDLAVSVGEAFDKAFDKRLGEHIGPMTEALEKLAAGMSSHNEEAVRRMINAFLERLEGSAGDRMQEVAATLAALGSRLEGLQESLGEAAVRLAQAADSMARRMGEGAEQALSRITDQVAGAVEALRAAADQTRAAGTDAGEQLAGRIAAAATGFEAAARAVAATLSTTANEMQRRMAEEAQATHGRLAEQFARMVEELRALSEASRSAGAAAIDTLAERVAMAASGFETTAGKVAAILESAGEASGGAFGRGAEEAVRRIAEATEGMRGELRGMLEELGRATAAAGVSVRSEAVAGAEVLRGSLDEAAKSLAAAVAGAARDVQASGQAAAEALRSGGEAAGRRLEAAGMGVAGPLESLAGRARELAQAGTDLASRIAQLDRAAGEAAERLRETAQGLQAAGAAAQDAMEPLRESAAGLRTAAQELAGALTRLQAAQAASGKLAEGLTLAAARFEGVDRELARTLEELQKGLQGFTRQVTEFVTQMDKDIARAINNLGSSVKDLEETLGDFLEQAKRG